MSLFKINRGDESNLPTKLTDGYCYVTLDKKKFYFDHEDETGQIKRSSLNAEHADTCTKLETSVKIGNAEFDGSKEITLSQIGIKSGTYTLSKDNWVDNSQIIEVKGVTANNTIIVGPTSDIKDEYDSREVICISQTLDSLTFSCSSNPTLDLIVNIVIIG